MKKIILLIMILVQTVSFAQEEMMFNPNVFQMEMATSLEVNGEAPMKPNLSNPSHTIEKRLKLSLVDRGVKSDSILLWGADRTVKFLPASELGGGGSVGLQSVLEVGSNAYLSDPFSLGNATEIGFGNNGQNLVSRTDGYYTSSFTQDPYRTKIVSKTGDWSSNTGSALIIDQSGIGFGVEIGIWGKAGPDVISRTATFNPYSLTESRNYTLPDKNGTIALLSDLPLSSEPTATSPFKFINEGNGDGIGLTYSNRANYGDIGLRAIDFGYSAYENVSNGAMGEASTISGGFENMAHGIGSVVAGGYQNITGTLQLPYTGHYSVVSGGSANKASGQYSVVSGGAANNAAEYYSTIAGGENNSTLFGFAATISGGSYNTAYGQYAAIAGGASNYAPSFCEFVAGGYGTDYAPAGRLNWQATDRIFNIGNGVFNSRSNAMTILKNGLATLPSVNNTLIENEPTGKAIVTTEYLKSKYVKFGTIAPTSSTDAGIVGEIRLTASYLYSCVATNTWVRSTVETSF